MKIDVLICSHNRILGIFNVITDTNTMQNIPKINKTALQNPKTD